MVSQAKLVALNMQVDDLCENFGDYLAELNTDTAFTDKYLSYHKRTMNLRDKFGGAAKSIDSDEYLDSLYATLDAFGMNIKGAKMQERPIFAERVREYKCAIVALEGVGAAQIDADIAGKLWGIIQGMKLSQTQSQTVTGAKALHHLLPRLLPPIDRRYTVTFFRASSFQYNQEGAFKLMLPYFARIAQRVDLERYVGTADWATSESKLIDNAIIGYCKWHPGLQLKYTQNGIRIDKQMDALTHILSCQMCNDLMVP